jgi:hypothetical protein
MTTTCSTAVRSLRIIAAINLRQSRNAKSRGRLVLAAAHLQIAIDCRADAKLLCDTAAPDPLRWDCGSGQDYGICKSCGQGHGYHIALGERPTSN